jgi:predicted O-linked N-acetylglucosamine transferase (SPINDLY family)
VCECVGVRVCWCVVDVLWTQGAITEKLEYPVADGVIAPPEYAHHWTERLLLLPLPALVKVLVAFFVCAFAEADGAC